MGGPFSLSEFIDLRKQCIFCGVPMRTLLTTYLAKPVADEAGFPLTISVLKNDKFLLNNMIQTTNIHGGIIDVIANTLSFGMNDSSITPYLDCYIAKNTFEDLSPHVEISCPNHNCQTLYHICSKGLTLSGVDKELILPLWSISPLEVLWESISTETSVIHNMWPCLGENGSLHIYSKHNSEVPPLEFPSLDFQELGKERILSKINIMKTFA